MNVSQHDRQVAILLIAGGHREMQPASEHALAVLEMLGEDSRPITQPERGAALRRLHDNQALSWRDIDALLDFIDGGKD